MAGVSEIDWLIAFAQPHHGGLGPPWGLPRLRMEAGSAVLGPRAGAATKVKLALAEPIRNRHRVWTAKGLAPSDAVGCCDRDQLRSGTPKARARPSVSAVDRGRVNGWDEETYTSRYSDYRFPTEIIGHARWMSAE
jgi:hypothetical protein